MGSLWWMCGGTPGRTAGKACIRGGMSRSISRCSGSSRSVWIIGGLVLALVRPRYVVSLYSLSLSTVIPSIALFKIEKALVYERNIRQYRGL